MNTQLRVAGLQKEGRLQLALQAYNQSHFQTPTAAAKDYDVPKTTLHRRKAGILPRLGSVAKNRLLTITEEDSLVQWILSMDSRGMSPRQAIIRQMATILLGQRKPSPYVGQV
jgi:hypothetical protein